MEKSGYNSYTAGPQYNNTGNSNSSEFNPNNPFRNPNALGAPPPPSYEHSTGGSSPYNGGGYAQNNQGPFSPNNTGYNQNSGAFAPNNSSGTFAPSNTGGAFPPRNMSGGSFPQNNSGGAFATSYNQGGGSFSSPNNGGFGDEKSGGQTIRGGNWEGNNNSYQQGQPPKFTPPPGPPSQSNSYGNTGYPQDSKGSNNYQSGSTSRDLGPASLDTGFSNRDYQGSYNQGPQQGQGHWYNNNNQYQSSPGPTDASGSRGVFSSSPQQQQQQPMQMQPYQPSANKAGAPGLLGKLGGKNPLDPPPPQFARPAPGNYPYHMFPPMVCLGMSAKLDDGWPILPPPAPHGMEHPFMSHDVTEEDWTKLLKDLKSVVQLSGKDRIISNGIPMAMGMSFMGGMLASRVIENKMKTKKVGPEGDLIDAWNNYFFHPRRMTVVLCQASQRFSGTIDDLPPDMMHGRRGGNDYDSDSDSDRSSHSAYDNRGRHNQSNSYSSGGGFLSAGNNGGGRRSRSFGPVARISDRRDRRADRRNARHDRIGGLIGGVGGLLGGGQQQQQQQQQQYQQSSSSRSMGGGSSGRVDRHGNSTEKWRLVICFWDGRREVV